MELSLFRQNTIWSQKRQGGLQKQTGFWVEAAYQSGEEAQEPLQVRTPAKVLVPECHLSLGSPCPMSHAANRTEASLVGPSAFSPLTQCGHPWDTLKDLLKE